MKLAKAALMLSCAFLMGRPATGLAELNDLIPGLYGGDGITLVPNPMSVDHAAHFKQASGSALNQLNQQLGTEFGAFPFSSSAGNFTFALNPDLGTFVSTTETLGPIFAERAPTLGKGKWSLSFFSTFFDYDELNGESLHDLHAIALHDADTQPPNADPDPTPGVRGGFELDSIDISVDVDASVRIFSAAVTYGVTDKLDVSVLMPIVSVDMGVRSNYRLVVAPPDTGVHNTNVAVGAEPPTDRAHDSSFGIGDVVLGAKYHFFKSQAVDFSGATLVKLATGDEDEFLGSGDYTVRPFLVFSRAFRGVVMDGFDITPHLNVGYEFNATEFDRSGLHYVAGFDAGTRRITLAADFLGRNSNEGEDRYDVAVGVKWNPYKRLVLSGNVILPLNDEGLRSDLITTLGIGVSF